MVSRGESKSSRAGDAAPDAQSANLSEAVTAGRLEGLRALRAVLAAEIEQGPKTLANGVSQTAALTRQLREVLREIADLEKLSPRKSVVDDLAHRRTKRRADTKGAAPAAGDR